MKFYSVCFVFAMSEMVHQHAQEEQHQTCDKYGGLESLAHCNLSKHMQMDETQAKIQKTSSSIWQHICSI